MSSHIRAVTSRFFLVRDMFLAFPRAAQVLLLGCTLLTACISLFVLLKAMGMWAESFGRIDDAESQLGRLLGYVASEEQFVKAANQSQAMLGRMAFPDSGDSGRGGALLQQTVRQLAGEAGLSISGSELRAPVSLGALSKMTVGLTLNGKPADFIEFLRDVNANKPLLFVESINLGTVGRRAARGRQNADATINAELLISAYRQSSNEDVDDAS